VPNLFARGVKEALVEIFDDTYEDLFNQKTDESRADNLDPRNFNSSYNGLHATNSVSF